MRRSLFFSLLVAACGAVACANVLGLDNVRNCEGAECGDATAPDAPAVDAPGETSVDGAAFSPSDFGGDLVLWLEGDQKVQASGSAVSAWGDLSPNDFVAVQTSSSNQPVLHKQGVRGHDSILFLDSTSYLLIADPSDAGSPLQFGANRDFVIGAVLVARDDTNTPASIWNKAKQAGFPPTHYADGVMFGLGIDQIDLLDSGVPDSSAFAGRISYQSGLSAPETVWSFGPSGLGADATAHIVTLHRSVTNLGTTLEIRVDATPGMSKTVTSWDVSNPGTPLTIGGPHLAGATFQAGMLLDIAEIVTVARNGAITAGEIAQLETYFKTKYAF